MRTALTLALLLIACPALAQDNPDVPPWTKEPPARVPAKPTPQPKVPLRWDRFYNVEELHEALRRLETAFPDLVDVRSIGKSVEGRDIPLAVVTSNETGPDTQKTAFWCDGNIHGNEVQGAEACLYLIWYLCENRDLPRVADLLRQFTFYVAPSINPDGRAHWFDAPNTTHGSRGGKRPVDNDRDGLFDEDPPNDIDGDGEILQMRVIDSNGDWKPHPEEPRLMVRTKPGERGRWRIVGQEGIDDDGDGRVNEDGPGGYDPNRDWPADWAGPAVQRGAGPYPVSLPETQAVVDFIWSHPNIAGFQSFHNTGGMILRGPGSKDFGRYPESDDRVMRAIAERGEAQLPHYRSMVIWKDLYQVHGGEVNFAYERMGIFAFTNELWSRSKYFARERTPGNEGRVERLKWDDEVELGRNYVDWKPVAHPTWGQVELGGWRKLTSRVPPPFMMQEELHRNAAFCLYHAAQMPRIAGQGASSRALGGGLFEVTVTVRNDGMIPTRSARAAEKKIGAPDRASLTGAGIEVISGGVLNRRTMRIERPQLRRPDDLRLHRGIDGDGALHLRWIVRGTGTATITYTADKGGTATLTVDVR